MQVTNVCGKLIPKVCSFWIKTPFLYHLTFAPGILPRGWWLAAAPHLLFGNITGGRMGPMTLREGGFRVKIENSVVIRTAQAIGCRSYLCERVLVEPYLLQNVIPCHLWLNFTPIEMRLHFCFMQLGGYLNLITTFLGCWLVFENIFGKQNENFLCLFLVINKMNFWNFLSGIVKWHVGVRLFLS